MKKIHILHNVLRVTGTLPLISSFIFILLIGSFGILVVEPSINSYTDALWFLFSSFTTIGYGDFTVVTFLGRIITVLVSLYGIFVVAFIPAVVINYYIEFNKAKKEETIIQFMDKLERLPSLSKEELEKISETVRKERYKL